MSLFDTAWCTGLEAADTQWSQDESQMVGGLIVGVRGIMMIEREGSAAVSPGLGLET